MEEKVVALISQAVDLGRKKPETPLEEIADNTWETIRNIMEMEGTLTTWAGKCRAESIARDAIGETVTMRGKLERARLELKGQRTRMETQRCEFEEILKALEKAESDLQIKVDENEILRKEVEETKSEKRCRTMELELALRRCTNEEEGSREGSRKGSKKSRESKETKNTRNDSEKKKKKKKKEEDVKTDKKARKKKEKKHSKTESEGDEVKPNLEPLPITPSKYRRERRYQSRIRQELKLQRETESKEETGAEGNGSSKGDKQERKGDQKPEQGSKQKILLEPRTNYTPKGKSKGKGLIVQKETIQQEDEGNNQSSGTGYDLDVPTSSSGYALPMQYPQHQYFQQQHQQQQQQLFQQQGQFLTVPVPVMNQLQHQQQQQQQQNEQQMRQICEEMLKNHNQQTPNMQRKKGKGNEGKYGQQDKKGKGAKKGKAKGEKEAGAKKDKELDEIVQARDRRNREREQNARKGKGKGKDGKEAPLGSPSNPFQPRWPKKEARANVEHKDEWEVEPKEAEKPKSLKFRTMPRSSTPPQGGQKRERPSTSPEEDRVQRVRRNMPLSSPTEDKASSSESTDTKRRNAKLLDWSSGSD